jgi:hypothetical protein
MAAPSLSSWDSVGTSISVTRDWVKLNLESQVACDMTLRLSVIGSRRLE